MSLYFLFKLYEKLFSKDYFYLIAMTIYHIEILIIVTFLGITIDTNTPMPMILPNQANELTFLNYQFSLSNFNAIFFTFMILLVDFLFLFIIQKEIRNHEEKNHMKFPFKLTTGRIFIIEIIVFYLSIGNPFMRAVLYFLSFSTIQIFFIYRILFNIPFFKLFFKPLFILGAYLAIMKLTLYSIYLRFIL